LKAYYPRLGNERVAWCLVLAEPRWWHVIKNKFQKRKEF
jgi:hypothetical protein